MAEQVLDDGAVIGRKLPSYRNYTPDEETQGVLDGLVVATSIWEPDSADLPHPDEVSRVERILAGEEEPEDVPQAGEPTPVVTNAAVTWLLDQLEAGREPLPEPVLVSGVRPTPDQGVNSLLDSME